SASAGLCPRGLLCSPTRRSSDLDQVGHVAHQAGAEQPVAFVGKEVDCLVLSVDLVEQTLQVEVARKAGAVLGRRSGSAAQFCHRDRKSTRLNSSHVSISYAVYRL